MSDIELPPDVGDSCSDAEVPEESDVELPDFCASCCRRDCLRKFGLNAAHCAAKLEVANRLDQMDMAGMFCGLECS